MKKTNMKRGLALALGVAGFLGLATGASQLSCAEAFVDWNIDEGSDNPNPDGGPADGDVTPDRCYTGTPTSEPQFYNKCTEAERIERTSNIPAMTWDGKSPLP